MAFNKAKALQEAHKYVTQGKTAQAIKQYERIIEEDPGDLTLLNVIGDLYAQDNNIREALNYFYQLADAYTREGYKVKAIAIYKKISKIDRNTAKPLLKLAELNAAQGLGREAREQYKNALEFFEKTNQKDKALGILRELCQLDPKNAEMRLKLAQSAERAGESKEAADAYLEAAVLAHQGEDLLAAESALRKASELAPDNPNVHLHRARQALTNQRPEEVEAILDSVPNLQSNPQAQRLLLDSYLAAGNLDAARSLLLGVFQSNPSDFSPVAEFVARCIEKQQYDTALEALTATAPDLIARRETGPLMETLRTLWKSAPKPIDTLELMYRVAEKTADEAAIPEVLEALGSACVQSDQLEKAEQAFARLAAREPENETYKDMLKQVLEKQGKEFLPLGQTPFMDAEVGLEVGPEFPGEGTTAGNSVDPGQAAIVRGAITNSDFFVRDGLTERAVEELEKVLQVYPDQIDINRRILEICREKLPGRAAQAAEVLAQACSAQGDSGAAKRYHEEALELAQTAASATAGSFSPSQDVSQAQPPAGGADQPPASVVIDLSQSAEWQGTPEGEAQLPPPQEIPLEFQTSQGSEPTTDGSLKPQGNYPEEQASPGSEQHAPAPYKAPVFNYEESREEIEFYIRHGFHDEARKAVSELEKKFPWDGRVAELRQRVEELSQESRPSEEFRAEAGTPTKETPGQEWELPTSFSETSEVGGSGEGGRLAGESGAADGRQDAAEHLAGELASTLEDIHDPTAAASVHATEPSQNAAPRSAEDASAELGSLLDELNDASEPIDQAADDDQTHYNLGVAFREMGLLDEAIGEFQKVVRQGGPKRFSPNFLQGCTLLAACFMEKGMPSIAAKWYSRALDAPGLDHEGMLALYYDLGIAFEKAGNTTAALEKFTEVYSQNIDYRDVAEKIRLLRQSTA
jgi:tetratricopeptide (TPR) repeat protein